MFGRQYVTNTWIIKNSSLIYRIARGFFRGLVLRKNTLKVVELFPTFQCNSVCSMCSVAKFRQPCKQEMTLDDYRRIAVETANMGAIAMVLLGGEPLMCPFVEEIVGIFKEQAFFVSMVSNSLLFTEKRARSLKEAGLDSVYFSLESLDEATNDSIRGVSGHHASVMASIRQAKAAKLNVGLATVILPGKMDRFKEVLRYCAENDLLCSGGEVAPVGAATDSSDLVSAVENQEIRGLLRKHSRLTFDWGLSYFLRCRCPAGKEKLGITCYGDVVGCSLNPISFGNIFKEPLQKVWERMGSFSQFKKNNPRCLSAADVDYINNYLSPLRENENNPVDFRLHPSMTSAMEPGLYNDDAGHK
jgi:MoaA/NifB/PqqE/SkfB family radical SAM enzyme